MPDWMSPQEAMAYFGGVDLEALEAMVLEYDMDVEVDDDGAIVAIDAADCRDALFPEYEKTHGHRPDDPSAVDKAEKEKEKKEQEEKQTRQAMRSRLVRRVSMRG